MAPAISISTLFPKCLTGYDSDQTDGKCESVQSANAVDANQWAVIVSSDRSTASAITTFKSDKREIYEEARRTASEQVDHSAFGNFEALLVDYRGLVLDGAISAVYFRRHNAWVTPLAGIGDGRWGALMSVTRRWALDQGLAIEGHIDAAAVVEGEKVWLSNGARGFFPGVIVRNLHCRKIGQSDYK